MKTILILGGGISGKNNLNLWAKSRCDMGIRIFKSKPDYYNIIVSSAGSYNVPNPIDKYGFVVSESQIMANYLISQGIPEKNIFRENCSYDTIGNIYFTKTTITDIKKWFELIIITSDFHMKRSKYICDYIFNLDTNKYYLIYVSIEYKDIDINIKNNRIQKEKKSLENFIKNVNNISSLEKFHQWLYTNHDCYKSNFQRTKFIKINDHLY